MAYVVGCHCLVIFCLLQLSSLLLTSPRTTSAGNFELDFKNLWGDDHTSILNDGRDLILSLDVDNGGSGYKSEDKYLFGRFDVEMKLVPGNSVGTVTTFYLSSTGDNHDEIDFEFVGNITTRLYLLHTNVFSQGKGNREQQFHLWFDPTADFHKYSIVWNPQRIIFFVDEIPIRVFNNMESIGVPFPKDQPMSIYLTLWNNNDWATNWGRVKTDWSRAPFVASYRNFDADACQWRSPGSSCIPTYDGEDDVKLRRWWNLGLSSTGRGNLKAVQRKYMIYNYCTDLSRFSRGSFSKLKRLPPECRISRFLQRGLDPTLFDI